MYKLILEHVIIQGSKKVIKDYTARVEAKLFRGKVKENIPCQKVENSSISKNNNCTGLELIKYD